LRIIIIRKYNFVHRCQAKFFNSFSTFPMFNSSLALRRWGWLHKWSSLLCTLFLMLLCLSGLPLIFSAEIRALGGEDLQVSRPLNATPASLDAVVATARAAYPALVPLYLFAPEEPGGAWLAKMDTRPDTDERAAKFARIDAFDARLLGAPRYDVGFMAWVYRLHVDLFAGLPGKLFLGAMGLLFVIAIASGIVLYAPFMRRLRFATLRTDRSRRTRWLDVHNLLGIVTVVWALVVGGTGVINTWADLILQHWQAQQLAQLRQTGSGEGISEGAVISPQQALQRALAAHPEMEVTTVAFPGTLLSTTRHYAIFMRGKSSLRAHLRQPVLVDRNTGALTEGAGRPFYVTVLQMAQPLHFGDYGGLPLKILWALLDAATLLVLGSGLYLWLARGRRAGEAR
jgi:uncharacterized iron-regulated membrane protein